MGQIYVNPNYYNSRYPNHGFVTNFILIAKIIIIIGYPCSFYRAEYLIDSHSYQRSHHTCLLVFNWANYAPCSYFKLIKVINKEWVYVYQILSYSQSKISLFLHHEMSQLQNLFSVIKSSIMHLWVYFIKLNPTTSIERQPWL